MAVPLVLPLAQGVFRLSQERQERQGEVLSDKTSDKAFDKLIMLLIGVMYIKLRWATLVHMVIAVSIQVERIKGFV